MSARPSPSFFAEACEIVRAPTLDELPPVRIGSVTLSMSQALQMYRERRESLDADIQSEAVALWNAIQRADKRAKGIPLTRLPFNPRTAPAVARIVRAVSGARDEADAA